MMGLGKNCVTGLKVNSNGCRALARRGRLPGQKEKLEGCCNLTMMYHPRCQPLLAMVTLRTTICHPGAVGQCPSGGISAENGTNVVGKGGG